MNLINISITITASQDDQLELGRIRDRLRVAEAEVGRLRMNLAAKDGHEEARGNMVQIELTQIVMICLVSLI